MIPTPATLIQGGAVGPVLVLMPELPIGGYFEDGKYVPVLFIDAVRLRLEGSDAEFIHPLDSYFGVELIETPLPPMIAAPVFRNPDGSQRRLGVTPFIIPCGRDE